MSMKRLVCCSVVLALSFGHLPATAAEEGKAPQRPNIIFILADDLSYGDLSCFGQKQFSTPNIDRLASEGRVFTSAYAAGSWCAPSRTGLLTGLNWTHAAPTVTADKKKTYRPTVAQLLKTAGYSTFALGKWHMQEGGNTWGHDGGKATTREEMKKGTVLSQMPWNRGFDVCRIGYRFGDNPYYPHGLEYGDNQEIPLPQNQQIDYRYLYKYQKEGGSLFNAQGRYMDKTGSSDLRYSEDLYREEAISFMRANKDKPFFLYYATSLMHGPLAVPSLGRFSDKPAEWTWSRKFWAAMVEYLDGSVGAILDEVKKLGIEKNTIICFSSDNGYSAWGYGLCGARWTDDPVFKNKGPWNRGKFVNTNGGVIVPFIAWGPGRIPAGKTDRAINFYDLMATAGELAGVKLLGPTDGVSIVPLLEGRDKDQPVRAAMVWKGTSGERMPSDPWGPEEKDPAKKPPLISDSVLLDEKWFAIALNRIIRPVPREPAPAESVHVFDITVDPGMEHDLAADRKDLCDRALNELKKP
jgi:arylsulfatase A-like enzyme